MCIPSKNMLIKVSTFYSKEKNETVDDNPLDLIPNNFGDLMFLRETKISLPDEFNGLERICLSANGNLQRILSSWFNKSITVQIIKNISVPIVRQESSAHGNQILQKFDREVNLICEGKIVCNALPSFQLQSVGRTATSWWREYTLKIMSVECKIKEYFPNGMFENGWIEIESSISNKKEKLNGENK
ncbi:7500_t:CDS:2, partial [Dentiscutata heterogama]